MDTCSRASRLRPIAPSRTVGHISRLSARLPAERRSSRRRRGARRVAVSLKSGTLPADSPFHVPFGPRRSADPVSSAFDESYFVGGTRSNYRDYADVESSIDIGFMPFVRRYAEASRRQDGEQPVSLDVGCAYGFYVERLAEAGFDAHGVDLSEYAVGRARARGVANVAVAGADSLPF